jgi:hypothetical protein
MESSLPLLVPAEQAHRLDPMPTRSQYPYDIFSGPSHDSPTRIECTPYFQHILSTPTADPQLQIHHPITQTYIAIPDMDTGMGEPASATSTTFSAASSSFSIPSSVSSFPSSIISATFPCPPYYRALAPSHGLEESTFGTTSGCNASMQDLISPYTRVQPPLIEACRPRRRTYDEPRSRASVACDHCRMRKAKVHLPLSLFSSLSDLTFGCLVLWRVSLPPLCSSEHHVQLYTYRPLDQVSQTSEKEYRVRCKLRGCRCTDIPYGRI